MHTVRGCRAAPESGEEMDHQAGPGSGGADSTAPEHTAPEDAVAEGTRPGEADAGQEAGAEQEAGAAETSAAGNDAAAEASEPIAPDTGEPRVDAALTLLDQLSELPVTEHAAVFEQVHAELTAVLGQLDPESADTDG
jgi:hypothetical protein